MSGLGGRCWIFRNNTGEKPENVDIDMEVHTLHFMLGEPWIIEKEDTARVCVDAFVPGERKRRVMLWYEIDSIYKDYLYKDRVDMFLVAILPYCMEKGYDIRVSDRTKVSADLLYQLKNMLIPTLKNAEPFHEINIEAEADYEKLRQGEGIATGVSGGVISISLPGNLSKSIWSLPAYRICLESKERGIGLLFLEANG